jgi:hypothetical protein
MKGFIYLADAARQHPDGTVSLLRGFIDRVQAPRNQPITFHGSFVARMTGSLGEEGPHAFKVRILMEDGQTVVPDITGSFVIPQGGGAATAVVDFAFILPSYGRYSFVLLTDNHELDTWEVRAVEIQSKTSGASQ